MSLLAPGQPVRGYDTGPGNMLLDTGSGARGQAVRQGRPMG